MRIFSMARRSNQLANWVAGGAIVALLLSLLTLLLPPELGGYAGWTDLHLVFHNLAAVLIRVIVFAMAGAALAGAWHNGRRNR